MELGRLEDASDRKHDELFAVCEVRHRSAGHVRRQLHLPHQLSAGLVESIESSDGTVHFFVRELGDAAADQGSDMREVIRKLPDGQKIGRRAVARRGWATRTAPRRRAERLFDFLTAPLGERCQVIFRIVPSS